MLWQTLRDLTFLDQLRFSIYDKKALVTLTVLGVADAGTLCREGEIPTSKIYISMEKLAHLGLVEIQPTRPKLYAALPADTVVERLIEITKENTDNFASKAQHLRDLLSKLPAHAKGHQTFVDLALGTEGHVRRHLIRLSAASRQILSYIEKGDLVAVDKSVSAGFPVLRRIARNTAERKIDHRVVFGFTYQTAPLLVDFLQRHGADLEHITGIRYSGELGHPFHVIDEATVVLPLDHPFVPEGRFASLLVQDKELALSLKNGFEVLWRKAMQDLREIDFHPGSSGSSD